MLMKCSVCAAFMLFMLFISERLSVKFNIIVQKMSMIMWLDTFMIICFKLFYVNGQTTKSYHHKCIYIGPHNYI